jgi:hypothetical protein
VNDRSLLLVFDRVLLVCGCSIKFCIVSKDLGQDRYSLVLIDLRVCKKKCGALQIRSWVGFLADSIAASQKKRKKETTPAAASPTLACLDRQCVERGILPSASTRLI